MSHHHRALLAALLLFVATTAGAAAAPLAGDGAAVVGPAVELAGLKGAMASAGALNLPIALLMMVALVSLFVGSRVERRQER